MLTEYLILRKSSTILKVGQYFYYVTIHAENVLSHNYMLQNSRNMGLEKWLHG